VKNHVKVWMESRHKGPEDTHCCEWCLVGYPVNRLEVHHIYHKGMGGGRHIETPETLIALCRGCHTAAHAYDVSGDELIARATLIHQIAKGGLPQKEEG
jgi:5-methylcytosine-specific restriction endonuclease McrA